MSQRDGFSRLSVASGGVVLVGLFCWAYQFHPGTRFGTAGFGYTRKVGRWKINSLFVHAQSCASETRCAMQIGGKLR